MIKNIFILILGIFISVFLLTNPVIAKTAEEYDAEIAQLEAKISQAQNSANTLSSQVSYYDNQIALAAVKIDQTIDQIKSYTEKINLLEVKLSSREQLLLRQIVSSYKQQRTQPLESLIGDGSFSKFLARFKYNRLLQTQSRKFLYDTQYIQTTYKDQKNLVEISQKKLAQQKDFLSKLRDQKNQLLVQTKNDEVTYQKLLAEAVSQRAALKQAAAGFGGSHILPAQPSPDGWYYNQRDERWGNICIGTTCSYKSPSFVWEVGCLITSVAMVQKKYGMDVTPASFATQSQYFFEDLLLIPWPTQPGYKFTRYAKNLPLLDSELSAGRPVILQLGLSKSSEHFVVAKVKIGSDYIINDPWFGPDLKFSDHYTLNNILSVSTYTRT